jgi:hypothetical protein
MQHPSEDITTPLWHGCIRVTNETVIYNCILKLKHSSHQWRFDGA